LFGDGQDSSRDRETATAEEGGESLVKTGKGRWASLFLSEARSKKRIERICDGGD
jgi:hypothetical protein